MNDDIINFCGLKANLVLDLETPARLPRCRWFLVNSLPRWQRDDVRAALVDALGCWTLIADVTVEESRSEDLADLLIRCIGLDGAYGVLADCELPGPRVQHMRLDTSEQWTVRLGQDVPRGLIDLNRVVRHEAGHYWGMGHAPQGSRNLMAPTYSAGIWEPQGWEVDQMQKAYGLPRATPTKPEPPPPGNPIIIRIYGADYIKVDGYDVIKE